MNSEDIIIVSGLPRSGTSLMMQILHQAGIEILEDGQRGSDKSNPKGYWEHEAVKGMAKDNSFLANARGKAVKIITQLIPFLDRSFSYKVIIMDRSIDEVLRSQNVMLGKDPDAVVPAIKAVFEKHKSNGETYLRESGIPYIIVEHGKLVKGETEEVDRLIEFLELDVDKDKLMEVIDPALYRQRN